MQNLYLVAFTSYLKGASVDYTYCETYDDALIILQQKGSASRGDAVIYKAVTVGTLPPSTWKLTPVKEGKLINIDATVSKESLP